MRKVVGILCGDIHLSQMPPIARAGEASWYDAMGRSLDQLRAVADKYKVPIICDGDIMDKWKSPPELINFALERMPDMWAIPGQHDLPYHSYEDMKKSAFYTLVEAGKVKLLDPDKPTDMPGPNALRIHAFPWGKEVTPCGAWRGIQLAVVHAYIWTAGHEYHGASVEKNVGGYKKALKLYQAAAFGDNHKGFMAKAGRCNVINTGGFMRRTADQVNYQPCVGLLYDDGTITQHAIETVDVVSTDHLELGPPPTSENVRAVDKFMAEIRKADDKGTSYEDALHHYLKTHKVKKGVRRKLEESING